MAQSTPNPTKASVPEKKPNHKTHIQDEAVRRLRALEILNQRVASTPMADIARNLNISVDTVEREIQWAKRNNLLERAEERLLGGLLTKAMDVVEAHLDGANLDAAKEVIKVFISANQQKARREEKQEDREFDLEDYFREKRAGRGVIDVQATPVAREDAPRAVLQGHHGGTPAGAAALPPGEAGQDAGQDPGHPHNAD